ncbi:MAG: hypothetical protein F6K00_19650 [Leptolyngbya sp. SIOISBB]|nr:hypothetical protein [Leptolyngbya sp. SIOISBB]
MADQWKVEQKDGKLAVSVNGQPLKHVENASYSYYPGDDYQQGTLQITVGVDSIELVSDTPINALLQPDESALESLKFLEESYKELKGQYHRMINDQRKQRAST